MYKLDKGRAYLQETNPSSGQSGCYTRTVTVRGQLQKENSGHEHQEAWLQDEPTGGKPPVVK
jgi:hypothetical protein